MTYALLLVLFPVSFLIQLSRVSFSTAVSTFPNYPYYIKHVTCNVSAVFLFFFSFLIFLLEVAGISDPTISFVLYKNDTCEKNNWPINLFICFFVCLFFTNSDEVLSYINCVIIEKWITIIINFLSQKQRSPSVDFLNFFFRFSPDDCKWITQQSLGCPLHFFQLIPPRPHVNVVFSLTWPWIVSTVTSAHAYMKNLHMPEHRFNSIRLKSTIFTDAQKSKRK